MKKPAPITRRDFVKSSATAAVGASFVLPAFARSVHVSHTDTLRVGLVGCGGRGTGAAQQALNADPNAILTAAGDVFMDRVEGAMSGLR
ncbi:MAG: twin-arginine translocation signal domain-containing protein, partial [Phycisphaerales bacterium]|nr:twin-arginine translocation signal domain-containing protein [Phycisphaerales bacterium]